MLIDLMQDWLQKATNKSQVLIILKFLHQLLDRYHSHDNCTCNSTNVKNLPNECEVNFSNGVLEEKVFVGQSPWYFKERQEKQVYKLNKVLYGLK